MQPASSEIFDLGLVVADGRFSTLHNTASPSGCFFSDVHFGSGLQISCSPFVVTWLPGHLIAHITHSGTTGKM